MGESGAAAFQFGPAEARARGVAPEELREALGLVQESVIKLLRFQLAMERRDRRVAMAVMDDVVLLERRLNSIVTRLPESPDAAAHPPHRAGLDAARSLLAREKFTLAAGAPGAAPGREEGPLVPPAEAEAEPLFLSPRDYLSAQRESEAAPAPKTWIRLAAGLLLAGGAAAAAILASGISLASLSGGYLG